MLSLTDCVTDISFLSVCHVVRQDFHLLLKFLLLNVTLLALYMHYYALFNRWRYQHIFSVGLSRCPPGFSAFFFLKLLLLNVTLLALCMHYHVLLIATGNAGVTR